MAEQFYVGHEAKIEALKTHRKLLEGIELLEHEFGLAIPHNKANLMLDASQCRLQHGQEKCGDYGHGLYPICIHFACIQ